LPRPGQLWLPSFGGVASPRRDLFQEEIRQLDTVISAPLAELTAAVTIVTTVSEPPGPLVPIG
jgi:hypothetical protein